MLWTICVLIRRFVTISRLYLTLSSNCSMEYYAENMAAQFMTKLSSLIELEGNWVVGLVEISVHSSTENASNAYYDAIR